jgi:ribosomal protein S15P/S13E
MDSKAGIKTVIDTFKQDLAKSIGAAATAVAMGTAMQDKKVVPANAQPAQESIDYNVKRLSEGQIYMLFNRVEKVNTHMLENKLMFESVFDAVSHYHRQNLNEGPMDALKGAASKVGGALKTGAKAVGAKAAQGAKIAGAAIGKGAKKAGAGIAGAAKQVTTKVTAEKLMTAWKKAGSPTDSDEVYNVIKGLGVNDDVIKGTYDSMKIQTPATAAAPAQEPAQEPAAGEEPEAPVDANNDGKDDATGEPMPAASNPLAKEKPADGEQPAAGGEQPATPAKPVDLKALATEISKLQQPVKDKIKQQLVAV